VRAADGVEVPFLLGVPAPGAPGQAIFRVGGHDVQNAATFDGKALKVALAVHQTTVDATLDPDGTLRGTFATTGRAWGASSIPLAATKIAAPTVSALATVAATGAALDLGEPRTVWRLAMSDSGVGKLVIDQPAAGELTGLLSLATGNLIYLAGNGRDHTIVLTGFDGTSGYRLELALGADHASASGKFFGGERLDWRETLNATRGAEFDLAIDTRPTRPGVRIGLPNQPELAALPPGPLLVEISASWCSTCRSAAPFLVELARTYGPRGLGMVTLLYDLTDDRAADARQAETFKATYGVTWPVVPVSGGLDVLSEILPSGVVGVNPAGFPITLFLAADRTLVALHAGFPAADAGAEFDRVTTEFRATIETLLARQPTKTTKPTTATKATRD
ncbi:MAG: TlpA disulfide reductase family protein, partial [Kofleriaceae bacterium]